MPRPANRPAFTLIELLLVMGVIGILAAVMIPLVGGAINSQRKARATGEIKALAGACDACLLYTSPSPRDGLLSRMPSSA